MSGSHAVAFINALLIVCKGPAAIPNVSLKNHGKPVFAERRAEILTEMYRGHPLNAYVQEGMEMREEIARDFAKEMVMSLADKKHEPKRLRKFTLAFVSS